MNGQGCTTPTLSNYMLERLRLKCPSKGHHLVMKVIANRFFSFFFPKSISSPITQGTINPPITVHLLFHVVIYVFFTIFHSLTMTVWQILRSFYVGHFKCRLYWRRWTRHRHPLKTCHSHPFPSSFSHLPKSKTAEPAKKKTVSTVLSHLPLAHLSLLQVTRTGPF